MTQPGEHPTIDEPVAKVLALAAQGYSGTAAAQAVGVPVRQAQRWITRARQELTPGNKPLLDKWTRRVDQSLDLLGDALDLIEADETGSLALKNMPNLNMVAGTGTDKLQKDQDQALKNRSNEAAHSLADAINRLATLDTSHLAGLIEAEYEVKDA